MDFFENHANMSDIEDEVQTPTNDDLDEDKPEGDDDDVRARFLL